MAEDPQGDPVKQSSAYWTRGSSLRVLDPDGWDRANLEEDWCRPITREEFWAKQAVSTCTDRADTSFGKGMDRYSCGDEDLVTPAPQPATITLEIDLSWSKENGWLATTDTIPGIHGLGESRLLAVADYLIEQGSYIRDWIQAVASGKAAPGVEDELRKLQAWAGER